MGKNSGKEKAEAISNVLIKAKDNAEISKNSMNISGEKVNDFENLFRERYAAATSQETALHTMDIDGTVSNDKGSQAVLSKRKRINPDAVDISCVSEQRDNIGTQNRFKLLGDLLIEEEQSSPAVDEKKNRNTNSFNSKKETFCPPIFLFNVNIPHLVQQLNTKKIAYKIVNTNKWKSKLYLKQSSVHSEMMAILRKANIDSYSYTPKDLKRTSVVLRGLHHKTDINDLKSELENLLPNTIDKVSKFTTDFSKKQNIDTGLFLITLCPGKLIKDLTALHFLQNQRISWELPKVNSRIPQCWRCQQWGHMSKNCNKPYVCVKCDEKHLPGKCNFVSSEVNLPYCTNCGERGHPSNYRGCKAYTTFMGRIQNKRKEASERKRQASVNVIQAVKGCGFINPEKSFASLFQKSAEHKGHSEKPAIIIEFLKIANTICNPQTLEDRIEFFMKSYKTMSRDEAVRQCLKLIDEVKQKYEP